MSDALKFERSCRMKSLKQSKWERSCPGSRTYWEEILTNVEKKCKRVRNSRLLSYRSSSDYILTPFAKRQLTDPIKFQISPPTPVRKALDSDLAVIPKIDLPKPPPKTSSKFSGKKFALRKPIFGKKVYPKNSCPHHKNAPVSQIFDDDIKNYLSCRPSFECFDNDDDVVTAVQKTEEEEKPKETEVTKEAEEKEEEEKDWKYEFLEVPQANSSPVLKASYVSEEKYSPDYPSTVTSEKNVDFSETLQQKTEKFLDSIYRDFNENYSEKVLNIMRNRRINLELQYRTSKVRKKLQKLMLKPKLMFAHPSKVHTELSLDFPEIRKSLRDYAEENLNYQFRAKNDEEKSTTIPSSTESVSSRSFPDSESTTSQKVTNPVLEELPRIQMLNRKNRDRCVACLTKSLEPEGPTHRELPLTVLTAFVKKFDDDVSSDTTSSSVSLDFPSPDLTVDRGYEEEDDDDVCEAEEKCDPAVPMLSLRSPSPDSRSTTSRDVTPKTQKQTKVSLDRAISRQSRGSSPSGQSSDSGEEFQIQESDRRRAEFRAPCHIPTTLVYSLEPLKALKNRKATSMKTRIAAVLASAKSEDSDSDTTTMTRSRRKSSAKSPKEDEEEEQEQVEAKDKKMLVRMKTVSEGMALSSPEAPKLKKSKTAGDLPELVDVSTIQELVAVSKPEVEGDQVEVEELEEPVVDLIGGSLMPVSDIIEVVKSCLVDGESVNVGRIIEQLKLKFAVLIEGYKKTLKDPEDVESADKGLKLLSVLVDSRKYLKPQLYDPNLQFSYEFQPSLTSSRQLKRVLSIDTYNGMAPVLRLPYWLETSKEAKKRTKSVEQEPKSDSDGADSGFSTEVYPPTPLKAKRKVNKLMAETGVNPYLEFLKKPRHKAVTWRKLTPEDLKGYDPEATLEMKASRLMDKICKDFCGWLGDLGSGEKLTLDPETLRDMFEVNFSSDACKATQFELKEMPIVPALVAQARNQPEASEVQATKLEVLGDKKRLKEPSNSVAFGRCVPHELRKVLPARGRRHPSRDWLRGKRDIPRDVEKMNVVWNGIMHLDSLQSFMEFLESNAVIVEPKYLRKLKERRAKESRSAKIKSDETADKKSEKITRESSTSDSSGISSN